MHIRFHPVLDYLFFGRVLPVSIVRVKGRGALHYNLPLNGFSEISCNSEAEVMQGTRREGRVDSSRHLHTEKGCARQKGAGISFLSIEVVQPWLLIIPALETMPRPIGMQGTDRDEALGSTASKRCLGTTASRLPRFPLHPSLPSTISPLSPRWSCLNLISSRKRVILSHRPPPLRKHCLLCCGMNGICVSISDNFTSTYYTL